MTFYVYRSDKSEGAAALVKALGAKRLGQDWTEHVTLAAGDVVVNWGARIGRVPTGVRVLNNANLLDKLQQIEVLTAAKVPTVVARTQAPDEWIHRQREHFDGNDLLRPGKEGGFWVKRENILKEVRIHSFNGLSIRAGMKVPASEKAHPWIRTYTAGWRIDCNGFRSSPEMREIAAKAVKALGLEFGAVDIGVREDKSLIVLEVNRSPGIENENTMPTYAEAIREWADAQ